MRGTSIFAPVLLDCLYTSALFPKGQSGDTSGSFRLQSKLRFYQCFYSCFHGVESLSVPCRLFLNPSASHYYYSHRSQATKDAARDPFFFSLSFLQQTEATQRLRKKKKRKRKIIRNPATLCSYKVDREVDENMHVFVCL